MNFVIFHFNKCNFISLIGFNWLDLIYVIRDLSIFSLSSTGESILDEQLKQNELHIPGGGFLVQRSVWGRAAEMGLKISLLV